jgi:hypothetical protein
MILGTQIFEFILIATIIYSIFSKHSQKYSIFPQNKEKTSKNIENFYFSTKFAYKTTGKIWSHLVGAVGKGFKRGRPAPR